MSLSASLLPSNDRASEGTPSYYWQRENVEAPRGLGGIFSRAWNHLFPREEPRPQSQYFALVPLDDYRLRPRRTKLLVGLFSLLALLLAGLVFVAVPRGVSVGTVSVEAVHMTWNKTLGTYQLQLRVLVPISNPNYVPVVLEGNVSIAFYDAEAGSQQLQHVTVPRRAEPYRLQMAVDASNVPEDYTLTVLEQCSLFPRKLIFLLRGQLQATYLLRTRELSTIDTYFLIDCKRDGTQLLPQSLPVASASAALELPGKTVNDTTRRRDPAGSVAPRRARMDQTA